MAQHGEEVVADAHLLFGQRARFLLALQEGGAFGVGRGQLVAGVADAALQVVEFGDAGARPWRQRAVAERGRAGGRAMGRVHQAPAEQRRGAGRDQQGGQHAERRQHDRALGGAIDLGGRHADGDDPARHRRTGERMVAVDAAAGGEAHQAARLAGGGAHQERVGGVAQSRRLVRARDEMAGAVDHRLLPAGRYGAPGDHVGKVMRREYRAEHVAAAAIDRHRNIDGGDGDLLHRALDQARDHGLAAVDDVAGAGAHVVGRRRQLGAERHHGVDQLLAAGQEQDGASAVAAVGGARVAVEAAHVAAGQVRRQRQHVQRGFGAAQLSVHQQGSGVGGFPHGVQGRVALGTQQRAQCHRGEDGDRQHDGPGHDQEIRTDFHGRAIMPSWRADWREI